MTPSNDSGINFLSPSEMDYNLFKSYTYFYATKEQETDKVVDTACALMRDEMDVRFIQTAIHALETYDHKFVAHCLSLYLLIRNDITTPRNSSKEGFASTVKISSAQFRRIVDQLTNALTKHRTTGKLSAKDNIADMFIEFSLSLATEEHLETILQKLSARISSISVNSRYFGILQDSIKAIISITLTMKRQELNKILEIRDNVLFCLEGDEAVLKAYLLSSSNGRDLSLIATHNEKSFLFQVTRYFTYDPYFFTTLELDLKNNLNFHRETKDIEMQISVLGANYWLIGAKKISIGLSHVLEMSLSKHMRPLRRLLFDSDSHSREVPFAATAGVELSILCRLDGDAFIANAYSVLLGKGVDESGLAHYRHRMHSENASKRDVILEIRNSPEGLDKGVNIIGLHNEGSHTNSSDYDTLDNVEYIRLLYNSHLNKEVDAGGLNWYLYRLIFQNATRDDVQKEISASGG